MKQKLKYFCNIPCAYSFCQIRMIIKKVLTLKISTKKTQLDLLAVFQYIEN